jgi:hypothetical protein
MGHEVVVDGLCDVWLEEEDLLVSGHAIPSEPAPLIDISAESLHVQLLSIAAPVYT